MQERAERSAIGFGRDRPPFGRQRLPPGRRAAGQRVLVDDANAATQTEIADTEIALQLPGERRDLFDRFDERPDLCELGADVHLHALELQVRILGGGGISRGRELQRDAELVFTFAGRDLGVRLGVHVGIHADGDRRPTAELAGDVVDAGQFGLALGMEGEDARFERQADFRFRLADAGEDAAVGLGAGGEHTAQLAAAHHIKSRPQVG